MTEDEMVGWHHRLNGHGFGWTPGVDDGQGGLACCGSWGHKEFDGHYLVTEQQRVSYKFPSRSKHLLTSWLLPSPEQFE